MQGPLAFDTAPIFSPYFGCKANFPRLSVGNGDHQTNNICDTQIKSYLQLTLGDLNIFKQS